MCGVQTIASKPHDCSPPGHTSLTRAMSIGHRSKRRPDTMIAVAASRSTEFGHLIDRPASSLSAPLARLDLATTVLLLGGW